MLISPGDKLEIYLTLGGVPYAKTRVFGIGQDDHALAYRATQMLNELLDDITRYADEPPEAG